MNESLNKRYLLTLPWPRFMTHRGMGWLDDRWMKMNHLPFVAEITDNRNQGIIIRLCLPVNMHPSSQTRFGCPSHPTIKRFQSIATTKSYKSQIISMWLSESEDTSTYIHTHIPHTYLIRIPKSSTFLFKSTISKKFHNISTLVTSWDYPKASQKRQAAPNIEIAPAEDLGLELQ